MDFEFVASTLAMSKRHIALLFSLFAFAGTSGAQQWFARGVPPIPFRQGWAMAYDEVRRETVLFGGIGFYPNIFGDTWVWNGTSWTQRQPSASPPPRSGAAMAFDPIRGVLVLFGGSNRSTTFRDTWIWNGVTWGPQFTASAPSPSGGGSLAFDASRGKLILLSWSNSETWELDGQGWTQRFPAQNPPIPGPLVTNPLNGRVVGWSSPGAASDVWEFDGSTSAGAWAIMDWNTPRFQALSRAPGNRLVGFDGPYGIANVSVYERVGNGWVLRTPGQVPGAAHLKCAYDVARRVSVVVLDNGRLETWEYDNEARLAAANTFGIGCGSPPLTIAPAAGSRPLLGSVFTTEVSNVPSFGAVLAIGLSGSQLGSFSLPLPLDFFGMTGCFLYQDLILSDQPIAMTSSSAGRYSVLLPSIRSIVGGEFHLQALGIAPGANPAGVVLSNHISCVAGTF